MADSDVEALRAELAKWQERVPKLAGALRERNNEVEALKSQLAERPGGDAAPAAESGSGIQARDALIEELEAKVKALGGKYQDAEGQLHARDLEITQLRQEAAEWRDKWQSVTSSLDAQADNAGQKDRELKRLKGEVDELLALQGTHTGRIKEQDLELTQLRERAQSLEGRNENLFETTELANRQIETLGENLEHLRADLAASKDLLAKHEAAAGGASKEMEDLRGQVASRDEDIQFLHTRVEEKQTEIDRLSTRVDELSPLEAANAEAVRDKESLESKVESLNEEIEALTARLVEFEATRKSLEEAEGRIASLESSLAEQGADVAARDELIQGNEVALVTLKEEVQRLESCVANAEEATIRHEVERRQISEQLDELKKRNQHLESQLTERSDLVVGLEQEKSAISDKTSSLEAENARLSEALEKAQQAAAGNADHIAQVDSRMERQKQLMENLELEFAEVQEEYAAAVKSHQREVSEKESEIAALREKVDDDSVVALKQELVELEEALAAAKSTISDADAAASEARAEAQSSANAIQELESRVAEESSARQAQAENMAELEKQLKKQTQAAVDAEEAAQSARAELLEATAQVSRVPDDVSDENEALQAEVIKLEGMVRERTEQLNKLRWQQDMIEKQGGSDSQDSKMLVVLNQQLQSAREENQRLKDKVRELETAPAPAPAAVDPAEMDEPDDLSSIKGIGPKLVKQLRKLGITRFDQISMLSESDLDDKKHPLHSMKGRIVKDQWIEQAARLGGIG
jgi:predicted flap endonuclease-1-like 5' DNA nuclease